MSNPSCHAAIAEDEAARPAEREWGVRRPLVVLLAATLCHRQMAAGRAEVVSGG
jgi:hypothetical protein